MKGKKPIAYQGVGVAEIFLKQTEEKKILDPCYCPHIQNMEVIIIKSGIPLGSSLFELNKFGLGSGISLSPLFRMFSNREQNRSEREVTKSICNFL